MAFRNLCLLAVLSASFVACGARAESVKEYGVKATGSETRTWAVGRHLLDLPKTWEYSGGSEVTLYFGLGSDFETVDVTVVGQRVDSGTFHRAVDRRVELLSGVENSAVERSMLIARSSASESEVALSFYRSRSRSDSRTHEVHLLIKGIYVLLRANSYESNFHHVQARLAMIAGQIDGVIVPERVGAGFVLGPIIIRSAHDHESGTINFFDSEKRDVKLEVHASAVTPDESPRLSGRMSRDMEAFGLPDDAVLRSGEVAIAGMSGEEVLLGYEVEEDSNRAQRELLFVAESYRPTPGLMWPAFALRLNAGGVPRPKPRERGAGEMSIAGLPSFARPYRPSTYQAPRESIGASLTDDEAKAIWRSVLGSLRPRRGSVEPPKPRLTTLRLDPAEGDQQKSAFDAWWETVPELPDWPSPDRG